MDLSSVYDLDLYESSNNYGNRKKQ